MAETTDLQRLVVSLEARLNQYDRAMRKAESDTAAWAGRVGAHWTALERQLSGFGRTLIGGFVGLAGIRAFGEAIDKIANVGEIAGRIGISTEALQAMHAIALQTGASIEQVDKALQSVAEQSAQSGSFLDKLFQANNLKVSTTDTEANLRHLMDLLKNATSASQQLFIATSIFGDKVGRQVVEAFSKGGPAIDEMFKELIASNRAFSDSAIGEADKIRQEYRQVAADVESTWEHMALAIIDGIKRIGPEVGKIFPGIMKGAEGVLQGDWKKAFFGDFADFISITPEGKLRIGLPEIATPTRGGLGGTPNAVVPISAREPPTQPPLSADVLKQFVDRLIGVESGGVATAKNPLSTATGLGQFIENTWIDQFKKVFPAQAATMSREAILAMRKDADTSRALIENYAKENAEILQKAGISVNNAALYLAHFLGPTGAINVLKAPAGAQLSGLLSPKVVAANPTVLGGDKTVADLLAYIQAKFPGTPMAPMPAAAAAPAAGTGVAGTGSTQLPLTAEELKKLTDSLDVARDAVKGFFSDLISGLREGASLTETLSRAFDNLASKAIDNALQQIVDLLLGSPGTARGGFLGGLLNFGQPQPRAAGGPVSAGVPYLIGEQGREVFVPQAAGRIVPNSGVDGGGLAVHVVPSPYFDVRVIRLSSAGDMRTLDTARRSLPGTAATFQKLGTTSR